MNGKKGWPVTPSRHWVLLESTTSSNLGCMALSFRLSLVGDTCLQLPLTPNPASLMLAWGYKTTKLNRSFSSCKLS